MFGSKENGSWRTYSTNDVKEIVDKLSAGLINLGISCNDMTAENRDKIAIICKNRPEWVMLDLAVQMVGAVLVPIYPTININELQFVLQDSQVKMVFVNDNDNLQKVLAVRNNVPSIRKVYSFETLNECPSWNEVLQASTPETISRLGEISSRIRTEDLATIIYTSGTTGVPKGVMLSHGNILSNVMDSMPCFPPGENFRALSFLPLNHIFERMVTYIYMYKGTAIYYAEGMETIAENLKEVKPHLFTTVPRLLEKVYDKIMEKGAEQVGIKKKLFYWAHDLATKFEINTSLSPTYKLQLALANKIVFSKWREGLGGNIICIITGGAACQSRLIRIFTAAGITIMEGYGLTETSPVISVNRFQEEGRKFGSVGPLIDNVEVRIEEDGEILCKGPNIMMGYYKRPDLTAEVMTGEWFHTGDIGVIDGKFLKITDRKKEMFKTSGGKYVAPLPIENKLKESTFIEQVMVVGAERKFVSALIVPSFPNLNEWARKQGITSDGPTALIRDPRVIAHYRELIDSFNKFFNPVEQVKKFELLPTEWSIDGGEMTPKLSIKRKVIIEKYNEYVERIYN